MWMFKLFMFMDFHVFGVYLKHWMIERRGRTFSQILDYWCIPFSCSKCKVVGHLWKNCSSSGSDSDRYALEDVKAWTFVDNSDSDGSPSYSYIFFIRFSIKDSVGEPVFHGWSLEPKSFLRFLFRPYWMWICRKYGSKGWCKWWYLLRGWVFVYKGFP